MLQSNSKNPGTNDSAGGAQEVYALYRRLFDLQKITGTSYAFGPFKNMGVTAGFDWNTKNDAYGSKKRMFVVGPTFITDVSQGFFNISLLLLDESNDPNGGRNSYSSGRYHYKNHLDLSLGWGVPTGVDNLSFEGWADFIAAKGKLEDGADSAAETHLYTSLMYDVSAPVGASKNTLKIGAGYEYWKNKFGNKYSASVNPGALAKTPFVKVEYHF
jgi:nucleoside-specific outer membrane channel protein Tsx